MFYASKKVKAQVLAFLRAAAKKGGQAKSPAKTKASRENGKKGGRPKKAVKQAVS